VAGQQLIKLTLHLLCPNPDTRGTPGSLGFGWVDDWMGGWLGTSGGGDFVANILTQLLGVLAFLVPAC